MPNPLIDQGSLSLVRASVTWPSNSGLNVTAPYLAKAGIRLALQGKSTLYLPTMTGAVTSQEPFMMVDMTIHLLKSQSLSNQYKSQMESNALMGNASVRSDAVSLGVYQLINCAITGVRELDFSGQHEEFAVSIEGYYLCNANLFN